MGTAIRRALLTSVLLASCGGNTLGTSSRNNPDVAGRLAPAPTANWSKGLALRDAQKDRGAYFVPAALPASSTIVDTEPDGTKLATIDGLRVTVDPRGTIRAAPNRFAQTPKVVRLGAHLGGGYLFVVGPIVWKAAAWLDAAKPIWGSTSDVTTLYEGLDRVYARTTTGALSAFDAQSGMALELGGWPRTPGVTTLLALDRFRAVAIADLRGILFTEDAGKTWTAQLPTFEAQTLSRSPEGVVVSGQEGTVPPRPVRYLVGAQGFLASLPQERAPGVPTVTTPPAPTTTAGGRKEALQASRAANLVTEGWPLGDGTFLHAFEGDLVRYDTATFREIGRATSAFDEHRATCHGIALPKKADPNGFGFVCSEPEGVTAIYAYAAGGLQRRIRFSSPREVQVAGSGSLAIRGSCDDARYRASLGKGALSTYCIVNESGASREVDLRGAVDQARLVALADGRVVVLSPPHGVLGHARLSLLENGTAKTIPLQFAPNLTTKVAAILEHGLWLDGWEEREPGTLGGWVEANGTLVGIEIATLTGRTVAGAVLSDPIAYSTSGRFAFGWTTGRRGFETVDGGMHWEQVTVPDRDSGFASALRGCSPLGCVGRGWVRVGWGEAKDAPLPSVQGTKIKSARSPGLTMSCEFEKRVPASKQDDDEGHVVHVRGAVGAFSGFGRSAAVASATSTGEPFWSAPSPSMPKDNVVVHGDSFDLFGAGRNVGLIGRAYAWGPKGVDWDRGVSWNVYWLSPFDASSRPMHAKATTIPASVLDWLKPFAIRGGPSVSWQFAVDDPEHALLGMRSYVSGVFSTTLFTLESGRTPAQITRSDGEPFGQISGAVRIGARWVVLQTLSSSTEKERPAVSLFVIEGTSARLVARLPRLNGASNNVTIRLAAGPSDRTVGVIVDPSASSSERWAIPIKLDSGEVLDPEPLGLVDLTDRTQLRGCGRDVVSGGYRLDAPINGTVTIGEAGSIYNVIARLRVAQGSACIEAVTGSYNQAISDLSHLKPAASMPATTAADAPFAVSVAVSGTRQLLRCRNTR